jgi:hypothetical protein
MLMNAKEFAHELEKAASFIRQQQVEIEALKAAKIRAYNNGVEDGRKPDTNNKPVAWIGETLMGRQYINGQKDELPVGTALYTHPVEEQDESFDRTASHMAGEYVSYKVELTDEEINEIVWQQNLLLGNDDLRKFARAILRKAQEK